MLKRQLLAALIYALLPLLVLLSGTTAGLAAVDNTVCSVSDQVGCTPTNIKNNATEEIGAISSRAPIALGSVTGTNTITATAASANTPALTGYTNGQSFLIKLTNNITGAATLNIDSVGAKSIVSAAGAAVGSGDMLNTTIYVLIYYAANDEFRVVTALGTGSGAPAAAEYLVVSLSGSLTSERTLAVGTGLDTADGGANGAFTVSLDLTELSTVTLGAGSFTTMTFDAGAVDPVFTFGSGTLTLSALAQLNLDDELELRFFEEDAGGSNYKGFKSPASVSASTTCTFEDDANFIPDSCVGDGSDANTLGSDGDKGDITVGGTGTTLTIDNGAVGDSALAAGAVDGGAGGEIADDSITTDDIAANGVGASEIATDAVDSAEIAANAVGNSEMGDNAIGNTEMADNAIANAEMADNAVGNAEMADNAVGNAEMADNAINIAEMGDDAIGLDEVDLINGDTASNGDCLIARPSGTGGTFESTTCPGAGGGISNVVEDTSPTLGGDLEGGGFDLGTSGSQADDIFLAEGSIINWDAGDLTMTQTGNSLALAGGSLTGASVDAATTSAQGAVELATTAEADAGTDTARAVTPEGLKSAVTGKETIALLAGAGTLPSGGGIAPCTAVSAFDSGSNDVFLRQCSFNAGTDNAIYWFIPAPKSSDETVDLTATVDWTSATGTDATDDVIWTMACVAFSNDDAINGNAFPTVDTVTDTQTAAGDFLRSGSITAITPAGTWAEGDGLVCRLTRDADAGGDNFNGTAELLGVNLTITTNAMTDD